MATAPGTHLTRRQRFLIRLAWIVVKVFYRRLDVVGRERIPAGRPTVLVANHVNGLGDPVVLVGMLGVFPRFLAAAKLWRIRPLNHLLDFAYAVPVARRRDNDDTAANATTFAKCSEVLASGASIALFPEGEVHDQPGMLLPLKTGAARIALSAVADGGVRDLVIVPIGLSYEDRGRFRSDLAIQVGTPIEVAPWTDEYLRDGPEAVRSLTSAIADGLHEVTRNHASWREAEVVQNAVTVTVLSEPGFETRRARFAEQAAMHRELAAAIAARGGDGGAAFKGLEARVDDLRAHLAQLGASTPKDVVHLDPVRSGLRVARLGAEAAALTVPAAVGVALNAVPTLGAFVMGRRIKHPAWKATAKAGSGFVLVNVTWTAEAIYAGRRWGRRGALAVLVAAPLTGLAAIAWTATVKELRRDIRSSGWLDRPELEAARQSRDAVAAQVAELLAVDAVDTPDLAVDPAPSA